MLRRKTVTAIRSATAEITPEVSRPSLVRIVRDPTIRTTITTGTGLIINSQAGITTTIITIVITTTIIIAKSLESDIRLFFSTGLTSILPPATTYGFI
jgi:protein involved in polysaccharide export with SLBB domain